MVWLHKNSGNCTESLEIYGHGYALDLVEPTKPPRPTEITETTRFNYTIDLEEYKEQKALWVRADENLGKMRRTICQTVATTHISDLAADVESPREILAALKKRLCPTED